MSTGRRLNELRLAVMMLTRLPAGDLGETPPTLGAAQWAFPLVGVITGGIGWAAFVLAASVGLGPLLAGLVAIGAMAIVTGALHFDGLADFADSAGGRDPAQRLEIMRDSRIGSYGVLALILAVALQAAALAEIGAAASLPAFLFVAVLSRLAMVVILTALPPARGDGLGASAAGGGWVSLCPAAVAVLALAAALGAPAFACFLVVALSTTMIALSAKARLGGQTGDVLGASQVVAETAVWVSLAAMIGP